MNRRRIGDGVGTRALGFAAIGVAAVGLMGMPSIAGAAEAAKAKTAVQTKTAGQAKDSGEVVKTATSESKATPDAAPAANATDTAEKAKEAAKANSQTEIESTKTGETWWDSRGLLHLPVSAGPKLQAGLINPIGVGGEARIFNFVGIGFDYGWMPQFNVTPQGSTDTIGANWNGWDVNLQIFPARGAFYLGCGFGQQSVSASVTTNVSAGPLTVPVTVARSVSSTIIIPHIGWRWFTKFGMFFGTEIGVQVPVSYNSPAATITTSDNSVVGDAAVLAAQDRVNSFTNTFAKMLGTYPMPSITLLQVGFMF